MKQKLIALIDEYMYPSSVGGLADHLIEHGVELSQWTKVSEDTLPHFDDGFLTLQLLMGDGTVTVGWYDERAKCWHILPELSSEFRKACEGEKVVAWKELSKAPPKRK